MKKETSGVAVGVGLAAIAATAVGAYMLTVSTHANKNRKQAKAWIKTAQGEVVKRLKKIPDINEKTLHKVVKEVSAEYKKLKK